MLYRVWELRTAQGLTLRMLEERSGISRSEINNIENGKANPTIETLELLARGLGVSITELFEL